MEREQTKLLRAISQRLEKIEGKLDEQQQHIASLQHSEPPSTSSPQTLPVPLQPTSGGCSPAKCRPSDAASVLAADLELKRTASSAARDDAGKSSGWWGVLGQVSAPRDKAWLYPRTLPYMAYYEHMAYHASPALLLRLTARLSAYVPPAYIPVCISGVPQLGARGQAQPVATYLQRQGPNPRAASPSQRGAAIIARRGQREAPFGGRERRRRPSCQGCARRRQDERAVP